MRAFLDAFVEAFRRDPVSCVIFLAVACLGGNGCLGTIVHRSCP